MIIPDINLLVYAHNVAAPLHTKARDWWEDLLTNQQPIGIPWAVTFGFIRLVTHTHLAAIAIEHQCEIQSNDADFDRFPGLRWRNPLKL